jgi:ribosomal protein L11 methyltransferase
MYPTMQWIEIAVRAAPDEADLIADVMAEYGYQGVSVEHPDIQPDHWDEGELPPPDHFIVRAYLQADSRAEALRADLDAALSVRGFPLPSYGMVDEQDWANAWKSFYHTARVGQRMVVRPVWEDYTPEPDDIVISLDPGMAFGTGTHSTTRLCLESVEALMQPGLTVLDLGCGSGILAIAAAKLGAAKVVAVDIDPMAATITVENAAFNGVGEQIQAYHGTLETVLGSARRFDLLLANILARIIIELCSERLGEVIRPGGRAIFSGIIQEQVEDVRVALEGQAGLKVTHVRTEGDWVAMEATRPIEA